jgi:hypothetical protein
MKPTVVSDMSGHTPHGLKVLWVDRLDSGWPVRFGPHEDGRIDPDRRVPVAGAPSGEGLVV